MLLISILLLGTFLRFYNIDKESFWLDEGETGLAVKRYSTSQILYNIIQKGQVLPTYYYTHNSQLPVYFILIKEWSKIFGINELSLRSFSAIFGSLALILIFYLTKYLIDSRVALIATFLSSVNLTLIWYSQEARQYSYLLFLSLLSVILLLKCLKERRIIFILPLLIVNVLIVYSNFSWILFVTFQGLYALYVMYNDFKNKKIVHKKLIVIFLIIGFLYTPIIGRVIFSKDDTVRVYGRLDIEQIVKFWSQLSSWIYPSEEMREKIHGFSFDFGIYEWALLISVFLNIVLLTWLFLIGVKESLYKKNLLVLLFMFFIPILFALVLSVLHSKLNIFLLYQLIYIIPIFLVFVSVGILKTNIDKMLMIILVVISLLPLQAYYINIDKAQFREAVKLLPENELIIVSKTSAEKNVKYYYGDKDNVVGVEDITILKQYLKNKDSFWVLLTFTKYSDPEGKIKSFLNENYKLVDKKEFFDIELFHYKRI